MKFIKQFFTWWTEQTLNTRFYTWLKGEYVGSDEFGNRYYRARSAIPDSIPERRWVIYRGYSEASMVPPFSVTVNWRSIERLPPVYFNVPPLNTRLVADTDGVTKPSTLTWNGSSKKAPDTPAIAVKVEITKATSGGSQSGTVKAAVSKYMP